MSTTDQSSSGKRGIYYGWYIVAAVFFVALVSTGARSAMGNFIVPMSDEFGWNRTTISLAGVMGALVNGFSQPFLGRLFDMTGGRRVILCGIVVIGISTALLSLTFHILFLVFMFGIVASIASSASGLNNAGALLARWFRRRRATVMGISSAGASMGGLLLVPFAMYLLNATSWRFTWVVLGLAILLLAFPVAYMFLKENPADMGLQPDGDDAPPTDSQGAPVTRPSGPLEAQKWSQSFRSMPIWQMSAAYFVCGATTFLLSFHFVPFALDRGVEPNTAATVFGVMLGLNVFGSVGSGMLSDRFGRKNLLGLVYFLRGCGYMLLLFVPGDAALWMFAVVAGFSWFATPTLTTSLTADIYGLRVLGTVAGVSFLFHQLGGAASVLLAGVLYDIYGSYQVPFFIAGALLFPAAIASATIKEKKYSVRYQAPAMAAAPAGG